MPPPRLTRCHAGLTQHRFRQVDLNQIIPDSLFFYAGLCVAALIIIKASALILGCAGDPH